MEEERRSQLKLDKDCIICGEVYLAAEISSLVRDQFPWPRSLPYIITRLQINPSILFPRAILLSSLEYGNRSLLTKSVPSTNQSGGGCNKRLVLPPNLRRGWLT